MGPASRLTGHGRAIAVLGFVASAAMFFGYIGSVDWGEPGTEAYAAYERANRVLLLPLLVHLAGWALLASKVQNREGSSTR